MPLEAIPHRSSASQPPEVPSSASGEGLDGELRGGASSLCRHCASPVPRALRRSAREDQFCCAGCETVFRVLKSAGLDDYYAYRERLGEAGEPVVEEKPSSFQEFDSRSYRQLYCQAHEDGTLSTSFVLEGVHCAACVWLVERVGRVQPAVSAASLDISKARVDLTFDPQVASLSQIAQSLQRLGYFPRPFRAREAERARRRELRALLLRMGVAGAVAGNVMLMAFALYSGQVGIDEAGTMDLQTRRFFEWASLLVSLPALWAGSLFFRGAWAALRTRTAHMDLPIAMGILGGFVWGAYGVLSGRGEIYFDSITALVFFLLVGRYVQRRHQMAHSEAAELVHAVLPSTACALAHDQQDIEAESLEPSALQEISRDDIAPGTLVFIKTGAVLPVDGVVVSGSSSLDKSLLSGESRPVAVMEGVEVEAGALNLSSSLVVRATSSGADTRVSRLMDEVGRALSTKTPLVSQADRIAGVFTVSVILLAVGVGLAWWQVSAELGVERALSLLIVACPCALGLATPLSLSSAVRRAAQAKQLIFAPEALERLGRPCDIVLDKTGTLTHGRLRVIEFEGDERVFPGVLAIERDARHPVARALVEHCGATADAEVRIGPVNELGCQGLRSQFRGKPLVVGSEKLMRELDLPVESFLETAVRARPVGASPVFVAWGEHVCGRFWIGDELRDDAVESLVQLKKQGHRLHLLSGDHPAAAQDLAGELCKLSADPELFLSVRGGVTPEEKLHNVEELKNWGTGEASPRRPVVMVGDGINDAGALAIADVGVAVEGAAEASRLSAQVYLPLPGVSELLALTVGARRTLLVMRRGIIFSLVYNVVGISSAAMGLLGPLEAAILMPLSSLTVVTNAYRSRTFKSKQGEDQVDKRR